ncbi:MAG TPA: biotin--[acetyl-CoA-carboxylase] ligase [Phycisphaerae bacterium]|nr:biotin--[acetyl-CoA-carboxylase] ligase [Phycisphaerae bacterium]
MNPALLHASAVLEGLGTTRIGRKVRVLEETASTNDLALSEAETDPDADGLAVFAEFQTAGRGRQGRSWHAPRGASLLCSVLLIGRDEVARAGVLTLIGGVAACDAVREATDVWPALRWPNDLFVRGRKLGGVLVESRPIREGRRAWVIGVGINCYQHANHFPPGIRDRATSLELESSHPIDRTRLARELLRALDRWLAPDEQVDAERVHRAWLERDESIGHRVRILSEGRTFEGRTLDVDPQTGLLVQLDDGVRRWFDAARAQILP